MDGSQSGCNLPTSNACHLWHSSDALTALILYLQLFTHREDVDTLNRSELQKLTGEVMKFVAQDVGQGVEALKAACPVRSILRPRMLDLALLLWRRIWRFELVCQYCCLLRVCSLPSVISGVFDELNSGLAATRGAHIALPLKRQ